ncbi:hypothetical protein EAJ11_12305 [Bacteroides uniformis]|nr:hypothetical protein EAJ11_12305 [Bacteroides uniformis]
MRRTETFSSSSLIEAGDFGYPPVSGSFRKTIHRTDKAMPRIGSRIIIYYNQQHQSKNEE